MAFAPKPDIDPYGTLRSLVRWSVVCPGVAVQKLLLHALLHHLRVFEKQLTVQVPVHRGKAYGGKVLHNLKDTLKAWRCVMLLLALSTPAMQSQTVPVCRPCSSSQGGLQTLSLCKQSSICQSRCSFCCSSLTSAACPWSHCTVMILCGAGQCSAERFLDIVRRSTGGAW